LESIKAAFPHAESIGHDMAYPAMLTFLPAGLMGMVVVSLIAAYMSTISTHLNWGASYVVHDFYKRFVNTESSEKQQVLLGRIVTFFLMAVSGGIALLLKDAMEGFKILLQIGAGTGLIFILRWFWWRINAWSEITAMVVSFVIAVYLKFGHTSLGFDALPSWLSLVTSIIITTIAWVAVTYLTSPTEDMVLRNFIKKTNPGGPGWKKVMSKAMESGDDMSSINDEKWTVPQGILAMVIGCVFIYSLLVGLGYWLYGEHLIAIILTLLSIFSAFVLMKIWNNNR
ncbi:MAG: Na+:solute symporter, partial [Bacteroidetes bacterium]|nr:Na+:solute symporter [Bacteroidota bacterium]